jgi:hypothetical protein
VPVTLDLAVEPWTIIRTDDENNVYRIKAAKNPLLGVVVDDAIDQVFASPREELDSQWQLIPIPTVDV